MLSFLVPTWNKVILTILLLIAILALIFFFILIEEREFADPLISLFALPLVLFDVMTNSAFSPKECSILCYPSVSQILFLVMFDILVLYITSCAIVYFRKST